MFDSAMYKKKALVQLKGRWKYLLLQTAIVSALIIALLQPALAGAVALAGSPLFFFSCVLAVACAGVLLAADAGVYLRLLRSECKMNFSMFLRGLENWESAALGALWHTLWIFLWGLVLVIPGMIKLFSYSQMAFIIAEHPGISARKAMRISVLMTQGHKADLFMMALSFAGWLLLSLASCGIGFLWLKPYMTASFAHAYLALKNEAYASGRLSPADFAL